MRSASLVVLAIATLAAGCTPPGPPTTEQKCATAVAQQSGQAVDTITLRGTVPTAIGPKIYVVAGGATYTCQADSAGNIGAVELQG